MRNIIAIPIMLGLYLIAASLANDFACEVIENSAHPELLAAIEWVITACYLPQGNPPTSPSPSR